MKILEWILSIIAAFILIQTLFFKFTDHPESIYIFSAVGMEPWGRYITGGFELLAGIFLLIPRLRLFGAWLGLVIICGALFFHFTVLGIEIRGDGGQLFYYALTVFVCCSVILYLRKKENQQDKSEIII